MRTQCLLLAKQLGVAAIHFMILRMQLQNIGLGDASDSILKVNEEVFYYIVVFVFVTPVKTAIMTCSGELDLVVQSCT